MSISGGNTIELSEDKIKESNRLMYVSSGTLIVIMLSMTTCVMHNNTLGPARMKEEAVAEQAKYRVAELTVQNRIEKIKAMERMIKEGANPIAAACAVHGWNNDDIACIVAAGKNQKVTTEE